MAEKQLPAWDLSDLYESIDDRKIAVVTKRASRSLSAFSRRYRGQIRKLSAVPKRILKAFSEYEALLQETAKPVIYAQLVFADSSADARRGAFMQRMKTWHTSMEKELLFFELELLALKTTDLHRLAKDPVLKYYRNFLIQLANTKAHRLSEREEQILSDKALTGREAFTRLFDQELSQKEFCLKEGKKQLRLPEAEVLAMLYSPIRTRRRAGADALTAGLKEEARRLSFVFNTLIEDKAVEDKMRQFSYPEAQRHLANQISREMVDAMESAVVSHYKTVQDFYSFKRKLLKVDTLYDYDRYAPVAGTEKKLDFKGAKKLVLDAFAKFSPDYAAIAGEFFEKHWVDAAKRAGKRGGAFCSFVTPDRHPYVFLNYSGNIRDVFTLAHELGHAIHAYLMRGQNYLNFDVPLTIAETASVFAEMLLFEHLSASLQSRKELLSLYVGKVESVFATVFRQISLYRFEQVLHRMRREKGELLVEEINAIWRKSQQEMFGKSVNLTEGYDWWWSYIPHFIHTPFYVYAYAYGELLTMSLYAKYKKEGGSFVDKYMRALSLGSSKNPTDLLRPFGIDMTKKKFWEEGISLIQEMVAQARSFA